MSSVTTGEEIIRETPVVPVTWAALVGVIQLVVVLSVGFVAYGRIDERVEQMQSQGTPALKVHVDNQHKQELILTERVVSMEKDLKYIKEGIERIEKRLDRK